MMDTLWFYSDLGFWHVIDWQGLDHFYFIVTLALPFTFKQGKKLLLFIITTIPFEQNQNCSTTA